MRLVRGQFYGGAGETIYTPEQQALVHAAFVPLDTEEFKFTDDGKVDGWYKTHIWDLDIIPVEFISDFHGLVPIRLPTKLAEVFTTRATTVYNEHVKVVMPGIGMLQFNKVRVRYDCCTDELQAELSDGWRIIAVCPQADQRRPDYVLGKAEGACDS